MPENLNTQSLSTPKPVREETRTDLETAHKLLKKTDCSPKEYNTCTVSFEKQRASCKQESCDARKNLLAEMGKNSGAKYTALNNYVQGKQIESAKTKSIDQLNKSELKKLLKLIEEKIPNLSEEMTGSEFASLWNTVASSMSDEQWKLGDIDSMQDARLVQDEIITELIGTEVGYGDGYIKGSNKERGNYIQTTAEFEQTLKSQPVAEWNSLALANYFTMLQKEGLLCLTKIISVLGTKKTGQLQDVWKNPKDGDTGIAKGILAKNTQTAWIVEGIENLNVRNLLNIGNPENLEPVLEIVDATPNNASVVEDIITEASRGGRLLEITREKDVSNSCETMKKITVEARKKNYDLLLDEKKEEFILSLGPRFQNNTDILKSVREIVLSKTRVDLKLVIDGLNAKIEKHNNNPLNKNKEIEPVSISNWRGISNFLDTVENIELEKDYAEALSEISTINLQLAEIMKKQEEDESIIQNQPDAAYEADSIEREEDMTELIAQKKTAETKAKNILAKQKERAKDESSKQKIEKEQEILTDRIKRMNKAFKDRDPDTMREEAQQLEDMNDYFANGGWEAELEKADVVYKASMQDIYGEDWEEIVPNKEKPDCEPEETTDNKNESSEKTVMSPTAGKIKENINGGYSIYTPEGENIPITQEERNLAEENPEALKNIVNAYQFFKELNMEGVWEYREELAISMDDVDINPNDDSLKETELLKFGNKLIKILNKILDQQEEGKTQTIRLNPNNNSIALLGAELAKFSKSREFGGSDRTFDRFGNDRFKSWMKEYGVIGGITFHTHQIREMLK